MSCYEPTMNGTYTLTVTQGDCTSEFSDGYNVMWVGIGEQFANKAVKAYPTPSQGAITLEINTQTPDVFKMKVYDAMNAVVYQQDNIQVEGNYTNRIDLGHLSNGVYFMLIEGNTEQYFQKIVIRK